METNKFTPEQNPNVSGISQNVPNVVYDASEYAPQGPESKMDDSMMQQLPTPVVVQSVNSVPVAMPAQNIAVPQVSDDLNPVNAGDEDLIEKEWVHAAKKVLQDTIDKPYEREQQISQLRIDYLRKRYNRILGEAKE